MHPDLFSRGHSADDVKEALNEHYARDAKRVNLLDLAWLAALLFLIRDQDWTTIVVVAVGTSAFVMAWRTFIDNSNRNFHLHLLDWHEAQRRERR